MEVIGSDHFLVSGRFRLRLRANSRRGENQRAAVPDLQTLRDGSRVEEFQCALQNRFEYLAEEEDLDGRWSSFMQTITDVSLEVLGRDHRQTDNVICLKPPKILSARERKQRRGVIVIVRSTAG